MRLLQHERYNTMEDITENRKEQAKSKVTLKQKLAWMIRLQADDKMSVSAKLVGTRLALFHHEESGRCNPRQSVIAKAVCMERKTVNRLLAELKEAGWIGSTQTRGASHYTINVAHDLIEESLISDTSNDDPASEVSLISDSRCPPSGTPGVPQERHQVSLISDTRSPSDEERNLVSNRAPQPCPETVLVKPAPAGADQPAERTGEAAPSAKTASELDPVNDNMPAQAFHGRSLYVPGFILAFIRRENPEINLDHHLDRLDRTVPEHLGRDERIRWATNQLRAQRQAVTDRAS